MARSNAKPHQQLKMDESAIKHYLSMKPNWHDIINQGSIIFAPFNFPLHLHWIAVVMWVEGTDHFIRVYNSMGGKAWTDSNQHVASMFSFLYHKMKPSAPRVKWRVRPPHDEIRQLKNDSRCAIHVIGRCWQVSRGQFLSHKYDGRKQITDIGTYLSHHVLSMNPDLCADDVVAYT